MFIVLPALSASTRYTVPDRQADTAEKLQAEGGREGATVGVGVGVGNHAGEVAES